jgi:hypothetical protein
MHAKQRSNHTTRQVHEAPDPEHAGRHGHQEHVKPSCLLTLLLATLRVRAGSSLLSALERALVRWALERRRSKRRLEAGPLPAEVALATEDLLQGQHNQPQSTARHDARANDLNSPQLWHARVLVIPA